MYTHYFLDNLRTLYIFKCRWCRFDTLQTAFSSLDHPFEYISIPQFALICYIYRITQVCILQNMRYPNIYFAKTLCVFKIYDTIYVLQLYRFLSIISPFLFIQFIDLNWSIQWCPETLKINTKISQRNMSLIKWICQIISFI